MMRLKWLLSALVVILLVAALIWWERLAPAGEPKATAPATSPAVPPSPPAPPPASPAAAAFRQGKPIERVKAFYGEESARVGAIDPDPKATEARLRSVAAELNPAEITWLKDAALDEKRDGDGRFFAAYMLALNSSPAGVGALRDIALSPLAANKNRGIWELNRGIRAQAEEGLAHNRGEPSARDALLDVVQRQEDEFLRDRAHRGIYEWETGHPVEEQDKEALGKVLEKGPK